MNDEPEVELERAEREALAALRSGPQPPASLEARVTEGLRAAGLLDSRRESMTPARLRRWPAVAAALAASLAAFALGWWLRGPLPAAAPAGASGEAAPTERYVLLLRETGAALPPAEEARLVAEYGAWARDLRARGVAIDGEKLEEDGWLLGPGGAREPRGSSAGALGGYFVLDAASADEALALAEGCPHLRYGGRIELRRIAVLRRG